jgi:hypothetical protein
MIVKDSPLIRQSLSSGAIEANLLLMLTIQRVRTVTP